MITCSTRTAARTAASLMVVTTAVIAIGGFVPVHAQSDTQNEIDERLLACADISDTADRMSCFDDVVKGLKQGSESSEVADAESTTAPPVPAESPSAVSAPVAAGAAATTIPSAAAGVAASTSPSAPAAESSDASPTAASVESAPVEASQDTAVEDFGLEDQKVQAEKKQREQDASEIHSTILRSAKSGEYHFVVELDNGQVWEETDGSRRIGLPKVGLPVRVYKGRFGGYRMKIGDDNRVAWVRRLK